MKKIGIVIPVLNQFEFAIKALESVQVPENFNYELFIINNWSENNGVAAAWNIGTKKALDKKCEYILILNDDIVLAPKTIEHLLTLIDNDNIGVITATDYKNTMTADEVRKSELKIYDQDIIDAPDFACFMISKTSYNIVGEFDEGLYPAYFEDNDYCYRTILSGLKCVRSQIAMFYHYGSKTQNNGEEPVVPSEIFEKNKEYFRNKWGGEPGSEIHTHPWNNYSLDWTATKQNTP